MLRRHEYIVDIMAGARGLSSLNPGVSVGPGLTALTRMRRSFRSAVDVGAKKRMAAFVALRTLSEENPLLAAMDAVRIMDAPSESKGSDLCTVKSTPFTLMLKMES